MENSILKKLNELKIEEDTWIIYLFIILTSFYANNKERDYFINNNLQSRQEYQNIMIIIFTVLVLIYFYFTKNAYENIKELSVFDSKKKVRLTNLSFIASLLILISGLIYLYILYNDENIDVEIAFN